MDNEVKKFSEFIGIDLSGVPVTKVGDKIYFELKALIKTLQIKDIIDAVGDIDESDKIYLNGDKTKVYVNEPSLYGLVFKSPLPQAQKFIDWTMNDVVKTILTTGQYPGPNRTVH